MDSLVSIQIIGLDGIASGIEPKPASPVAEIQFAEHAIHNGSLGGDVVRRFGVDPGVDVPVASIDRLLVDVHAQVGNPALRQSVELSSAVGVDSAL